MSILSWKCDVLKDFPDKNDINGVTVIVGGSLAIDFGLGADLLKNTNSI